MRYRSLELLWRLLNYLSAIVFVTKNVFIIWLASLSCSNSLPQPNMYIFKKYANFTKLTFFPHQECLQNFNLGFFFIRLKKKIERQLRWRSPGTVVGWKFLSPKSLKSESDLEKVLYYDTDDLHNAEKGNGIVYHKQYAHTDIMTNVICQVSWLFSCFVNFVFVCLLFVCLLGCLFVCLFVCFSWGFG